MEVRIRLYTSYLKKYISTAKNDQEIVHGFVLPESSIQVHLAQVMGFSIASILVHSTSVTVLGLLKMKKRRKELTAFLLFSGQLIKTHKWTFWHVSELVQCFLFYNCSQEDRNPSELLT